MTTFSEDMIKLQVISCLYNASHQTSILSEVAALQTLSQVIAWFLTLEATARAASHFQPDTPASAIAPIKSDFQRRK